MNNRPTPETDAEVNELVTSNTYNMVTASFARRLERERDEAREEVAVLDERLIKVCQLGVNLLVEREDSRSLLREIFNLTQIGEPHPPELPMKALKAIADMIDEHLKEERK